MKLSYVVTSFINYEGSEVEGVFLSEESAKKFKVELEEKKESDEVRVTKWILRK